MIAVAVHNVRLSIIRVYFVVFASGLILGEGDVWAEAKKSSQPEFVCPTGYVKPKKIKRSDVYRGMPFQQGESAKFELRYFGALAGYGTLEVKKPLKYKGLWHRVFNADAKTGDWYKLIFVAHDILNAVSQPWDFGIAKFYMEQDEGKLFSSRLQKKKWLEFDHANCHVFEREKHRTKSEKKSEFDFYPKSLDTLGALYYIRTIDFVLKKKVRVPVYSSGKNWEAELIPVAREKIKTEAGQFDTMKVKVQTYIGQELEQKGDVYVWIDQKRPDRPLVRIEGDVKIGTVKLELVEFRSGRR